MNESLQKHTLEFLKSRHHLLAYLRGLCGDSHIAEEMLQEVWLRLSEAIDKGITIENTQSWSRGVARNLIKHHWRDKAKHQDLPDDNLLDLIDKSFEENNTNNDQYSDFIDALRDCVSELPLKAKALIEYKYKYNFTFEKIADKLNENKNALMMRASRLRSILQDCIQRKVSRV